MLSLSSGPYLMRHPSRANSPGFGVNSSRSASSFNSVTFYEIPQIFRALPVRVVVRTPSPCSSSRASVTFLSAHGHTNTLIYIYIYIVKLVTVVEGDPRAPFSIATTPRCKGGRYSFPWIDPLDPSYVPYVAER